MYLLQDPIPTSLLKISSDLVSRSIKLFQVILKYMGIDSPAILSLEENSLHRFQNKHVIILIGELVLSSSHR